MHICIGLVILRLIFHLYILYVNCFDPTFQSPQTISSSVSHTITSNHGATSIIPIGSNDKTTTGIQNRQSQGHILKMKDIEGHMDASNETEKTSQDDTSIYAVFGIGDKIILNDTVCPICLNEYEDGDTIQRNVSKCGNSSICEHIFHEQCIHAWIQETHHYSCPCCRCPFCYVESNSSEV